MGTPASWPRKRLHRSPLAKESVEIGLAPVFFLFFGQMISGFDEEWFPLPLQQMDWNQSEERKSLIRLSQERKERKTFGKRGNRFQSWRVLLKCSAHVVSLFVVLSVTAVMDVTDVAHGKTDDEDKQHFIPFQQWVASCRCCLSVSWRSSTNDEKWAGVGPFAHNAKYKI